MCGNSNGTEAELPPDADAAYAVIGGVGADVEPDVERNLKRS